MTADDHRCATPELSVPAVEWECPDCGNRWVASGEVTADGLLLIWLPIGNMDTDRAPTASGTPAPITTPHRRLEDLRTTGLLWALNRYVLHPRGLAIGLTYPPGATVAGIQEHRHQPTGFTILGPEDEPWRFDNEADRAGFALFQAFLADPHAKQ